jgi:hypothetical protein
MNILKWLFAAIATGLVLMAISTSDLFANETWEKSVMICDSDMEDMVEFYIEEGLVPIMAGTGKALYEGGTTGEDVITFVMQDPDGKFALIRYYGNPKRACLLGVGSNVTYDAEAMSKMLGTYAG